MRKWLRLYFLVIFFTVLSIFISYFYFKINRLDTFWSPWKFRKEVKLITPEAKFKVNLVKNGYLLKLKFIRHENQVMNVIINGKNLLEPYHYVTKKRLIEIHYLHIPKDYIQDGENEILIRFFHVFPPDIDLRLKNYRKQIGSNIFILFRDSNYFLSEKISLVSFVKFTFYVLLLLLFFLLVLKFFLISSWGRLLWLLFLGLLPWFILNLGLFLYNTFSSLYRVVITSRYFWGFGFITFFLMEILIIILGILKGYRRRTSVYPYRYLHWFVAESIEWFKDKPLSDKFIITFFMLFLMCAVLLVLEVKSGAECLADIAYFLLLTGVLIKFFNFLKEEKR